MRTAGTRHSVKRLRNPQAKSYTEQGQGHAASALPGGPYRIDVLEKTFGTKFGPPGSIANVTDALSVAGPGSRGIVYGENVGSSVGHVFNAVNQNGVVRLLDGQTGGAASLKGMTNFQLLRTN